MNDAPFIDLDVREFLERNLLSARRGHEDVADFFGVVAVLAFEADDEIKLLFLLHAPAWPRRRRWRSDQAR